MKSFKRESTASTGGLRRSGKLINDEYSDSIGFDTGEDALSLITKYNRLDKDMERRKISYASREEAYKQRIVELEEEISNQSFTKKTVDPGLSELKAIKAEILESVEMVQDRTARIMQEQERDLLRSFRARLFDVQTELEKEKSKRDDGLAAWRERHSQLESELEWASEVSNRLDKVNYTLTKENNDLKAKFQSQEQDRKLFIELLVSLKKDNALWRSKINDITTENDKLKIEVAEQLDALTSNEKTGIVTKAVSSVNAASGLTSPNGVSKDPATQVRDPLAQQRMESEDKFKDVNVRLRRLVAEERRALTQLRQSYAQELRTRTEMELLLRRCVEDIREAIADKHLEFAQFSNTTTSIGADITRLYTAKPGSTAMEAFDNDEEQRSLELLLSQERVVSLIYAKTFPVVSNGSGGPLLSSSSGGSSSRGFGKTSSAQGGGGARPNSSHNLTSSNTFMMQSSAGGIDGSLLAQAGGLEAILSNVMAESDDVAGGKE